MHNCCSHHENTIDGTAATMSAARLREAKAAARTDSSSGRFCRNQGWRLIWAMLMRSSARLANRRRTRSRPSDEMPRGTGYFPSRIACDVSEASDDAFQQLTVITMETSSDAGAPSSLYPAIATRCWEASRALPGAHNAAHLDGLLHVPRVAGVLKGVRAGQHDVQDDARAPQVCSGTLRAVGLPLVMLERHLSSVRDCRIPSQQNGQPP